MKKLWIGVCVCASAAFGGVVVVAQDRTDASAGSAIRRTYQVPAFDRVLLAGAHHVVIAVGAAQAIRAEGPKESLDLTELVVEHGELRIEPKDHHRHGEWPRYAPATYYVTVPRLTDATLAGSGDIRVDHVDGERFGATVAGSGMIDVHALRVGQAKLTMAGSGILSAHGSAQFSHVAIAGAGHIRAREVTSNTAAVSLVGAGDAALTVEREANVSVIGSGEVTIDGPARCSISRMGSGKVSCSGAGTRKS
jgi:hypothetical protein